MVPSQFDISHWGRYEPSQAEGVNWKMFSCVGGDVTMNLARLIEVVPPAGVDIGDFVQILPDADTQVGPAKFFRYSRD